MRQYEGECTRGLYILILRSQHTQNVHHDCAQHAQSLSITWEAEAEVAPAGAAALAAAEAAVPAVAAATIMCSAVCVLIRCRLSRAAAAAPAVEAQAWDPWAAAGAASRSSVAAAVLWWQRSFRSACVCALCGREAQVLAARGLSPACRDSRAGILCHRLQPATDDLSAAASLAPGGGLSAGARQKAAAVSQASSAAAALLEIALDRGPGDTAPVSDGPIQVRTVIVSSVFWETKQGFDELSD